MKNVCDSTVFRQHRTDRAAGSPPPVSLRDTHVTALVNGPFNPLLLFTPFCCILCASNSKATLKVLFFNSTFSFQDILIFFLYFHFLQTVLYIVFFKYSEEVDWLIYKTNPRKPLWMKYWKLNFSRICLCFYLKAVRMPWWEFTIQQRLQHFQP